MSDFEIDFEWPVAPKYEFRPAAADEIRDYQARHPNELSRIPEAEWPSYLGRLVPVGKARNHRPKAEMMKFAVRALVECEKTPFHQVALKVARAIGEIGPPAIGSFGELGGPAESGKMSWWRFVAQELRFMFEGKQLHWGFEYKWPHPAAQHQGDLGIYLVPDKDNKPLLALRPGDLRQALVLYAARMKATGTTFNICKNCKTPFLSGGSRGRNKKRGDARFCSDECRWKYHNESRRKAR
jgi:hypothetical protein